jgi:hypothetical protein
MHDELKALRESQAVLQREVSMQQGLEAQYAQRSALQVPMYQWSPFAIVVAAQCVRTNRQFECLRHLETPSTKTPNTTSSAGQGVCSGTEAGGSTVRQDCRGRGYLSEAAGSSAGRDRSRKGGGGGGAGHPAPCCGAPGAALEVAAPSQPMRLLQRVCV